MNQHLLFDAADMRLAAPADLVRSVHDVLSVKPVASTKSWFLGLAVAGGKLLPVTDIGALAGRRACNGRTLELEPSVGMAALRVDRVFGFSDVAPGDLCVAENEMESAAGTNLTLTEQAIVDNRRVFRILDVTALVQSPVFINIREV